MYTHTLHTHQSNHNLAVGEQMVLSCRTATSKQGHGVEMETVLIKDTADFNRMCAT